MRRSLFYYSSVASRRGDPQSPVCAAPRCRLYRPSCGTKRMINHLRSIVQWRSRVEDLFFPVTERYLSRRPKPDAPLPSHDGNPISPPHGRSSCTPDAAVRAGDGAPRAQAAAPRVPPVDHRAQRRHRPHEHLRAARPGPRARTARHEAAARDRHHRQRRRVRVRIRRQAAQAAAAVVVAVRHRHLPLSPVYPKPPRVGSRG